MSSPTHDHATVVPLTLPERICVQGEVWSTDSVRTMSPNVMLFALR